MYIPEKAIITARTQDESRRLLDFLIGNGYEWFKDSTDWHVYKEHTCYNIEPDNRIMYATDIWYQDKCERMDSGDFSIYNLREYVPEDPALRFISTDAFIALCCGHDSNTEDTDVDISTLI